MTSHADAADGRPEAGVDAVMSERRQLIALAYRLLGSLAEAEDAVQETYARWYAMPQPQRDAVENPGAWLTTVASRICLDLLGSARARRESYVGEWIPEPLPEHSEWITGWSGTTVDDPADRVTLDESVNMAFLVVLESMTPAERVAFILHDVFRYSFPEVAEIVGRTPAACRQLASSARRRIREARGSAGAATGQVGPATEGSASGQAGIAIGGSESGRAGLANGDPASGRAGRAAGGSASGRAGIGTRGPASGRAGLATGSPATGRARLAAEGSASGQVEPALRRPEAWQAGIVRDFKLAWEAKDINALIGLLDPNASLTADGGGLASSVLDPIEGAAAIARYLLALADFAPDMSLVERTVNGQPGLVARRGGATVTVAAFAFEGDRIKHIWGVRNPEKLQGWTASDADS